jgi:hypothetical protein
MGYSLSWRAAKLTNAIHAQIQEAELLTSKNASAP